MKLAVLVPILLGYFAIMTFLAYYGYRKTKSETDFLLAGRNIHPGVMALSYGATFISTSALVGFGGVSAVYGFGLLWLAFLNIFLGIFVAFALFGTRIRRLSLHLDARTFPSLLGKHYNSSFMTLFSGLMIFLFMPAYTSIVLIGGGRFMQEALGFDFHVALFLLAIIVGAYVLSGGLKAVMYTDAFCAVVMLVMMAFFLFSVYHATGGLWEAHRTLSSLQHLVPDTLAANGHQGWTAMPRLFSPIWWTLVSTLIMGVGIGVLAQPQLVMRCMTVQNDRALYRSVLVGGIFIFFMTGAAFMIGPLSNVYFFEQTGQISIVRAGGNVDLIIPALIDAMMPPWFVYLFMLTVLSAVISTVSSLIHVQSTAFGEDILKRFCRGNQTFRLTRLGVIIGMLAAVVLAYVLPPGVIAQATAFWFGICAAGFLPALVGAIYWKSSSRIGALASIVTGFTVSIFGFLFLHEKEAQAFGLARALFGKDTLLPYPFTHIDPLFYALPLSVIVFIAGSLLFKDEKVMSAHDNIQKSYSK